MIIPMNPRKICLSMKRVLKTIVLLLILALIGGIALYTVHKDRVHKALRVYLQDTLSASLKNDVNIGSLEFIPFQAISMDHITVASPGVTGATLADAKNITITFDVLSMIKDKSLKTTMVIDGMRVGDVLTNATIKTASRPAPVYSSVFDLSLLESIAILEADIATRPVKLRKASGLAQMDGLTPASGKFQFTCGDVAYIAAFSRSREEYRGYDFSLRSKSLNLKTTLTRDESIILVNEFKGALYLLNFDLKGEIRNYASPERTCTLNGMLQADLSELASLPGKAHTLAENHSISGRARSNVFLQTRKMGLSDWDASFSTSVSNIRIDSFRIKDITTKVTLKNGRISAPMTTADIYNGVLTSDFKMDIVERGRPYTLSLILNNLDFGRMMKDLAPSGANVWGKFDMAVALEGYASDANTATGNGKATLTEANMGPMPLLTPLFGDIFSALQNIVPSIKKINIYEAYADFKIKDRHLSTDNMTFVGDSVSVLSKGSVDFDGRLDFSFHNNLREVRPDDEDADSWQTAIRDGILKFGRLISRARLRGTIKEPKWDFDYVDPIQKLIGSNVKRFLSTFQ